MKDREKAIILMIGFSLLLLASASYGLFGFTLSELKVYFSMSEPHYFVFNGGPKLLFCICLVSVSMSFIFIFSREAYRLYRHTSLKANEVISDKIVLYFAVSILIPLMISIVWQIKMGAKWA